MCLVCGGKRRHENSRRGGAYQQAAAVTAHARHFGTVALELAAAELRQNCAARRANKHSEGGSAVFAQSTVARPPDGSFKRESTYGFMRTMTFDLYVCSAAAVTVTACKPGTAEHVVSARVHTHRHGWSSAAVCT